MRTIADFILEELSRENFVITSDWRLYVYYMRIARAHGYKLPDSQLLHKQIHKMCLDRQLESVPGVTGIFNVIVPFASSLPRSDEAIIQESNPTAVFSHFTALAFHNLTNEIPNSIFVTYVPHTTARIPLGTSPEDWNDVPEPPQRRPRTINSTNGNEFGDESKVRPVIWSQVKHDWDFGHIIGYVSATPIYVTDLERTLVDSIRSPEKCGGLSEAFHAWKRASDQMNVDRLVQYIDRINQALLRQRAGFILERLGKEHQRFDDWTRFATRGSSAKMDASSAFSSTYSERWNLSINVPDSTLSELDA